MQVLIADDSHLSRHLLQETLKSWGYDVVTVADGAKALSILDSDHAPALAILDWMMPGLTGPEVCRRLREKAREPYTYVLLLTSKNEKGDVVEGMDSGADDYVVKPFDKHELKVRLRAGTRIIDLQEQLVATREALRIQATCDYLTQIWNRSSILEILDREMSRTARERTAVGVVLADLDFFKSINDTYGHFAGDFALQEAVRRMQDSMRAYDSIGRYGGEEFLIVLPGTDEASCLNHAERMRLSIRAKPLQIGESAVKVSCSFGCSVGHGTDRTAEELIRAADEALYQAKREGRDRSILATAHKTEPALAAVSS